MWLALLPGGREKNRNKSKHLTMEVLEKEVALD